jgi:hypothetical protein
MLHRHVVPNAENEGKGDMLVMENQNEKSNPKKPTHRLYCRDVADV